MLLSFLFWNLNKQNLTARVARLTAIRGVDVLVLAENSIPIQDLLDALNTKGLQRSYCFPECDSRNLTILTRLQPLQVVEKYNDDLIGLNIRQLKVGPRPGILLAAVHYKSKLEWKDSAQYEGVTKHLAPTIADFENLLGHERTLLVGDLNMNPFDIAVASAYGLHGVMTRNLARPGERAVAGSPYRFFYNPMWSCFGDRRGDAPPGTHYYRSSEPGSYFWNIYDQVLLRPALMDGLGVLEVIHHDGAESLLTKNGLPSKTHASDHLPLFFQLEL